MKRAVKTKYPRVFSDGTNRAYEYCLDHWYEWSKTGPDKKWTGDQLEFSILQFIDSMQGDEKSLATVLQHVAALASRYGRGVRTDNIRRALAEYARVLGRPAKKAVAIGIEQLRAMVLATRSTRNQAILTVGWAGALRASELVAIRRSDLSLTTEGFTLMVRRSKSDQTGKGRVIPLPYYHVGHAVICPARNLETYLLHQLNLFTASPDDYQIFPIATRTVSRIVSRAARLASLPARYSSHSLRRGLATTAAQHGVDERVIMRHGRWTTREVVDGYIDEGTMWSLTALDFLR